MKRLLIFTDLDGTLLDHENYDWQPAQPSLDRLNQLQCPVIFNSSKTLAEITELASLLNINHPIICENGGVIAIPKNYFSSTATGEGFDMKIFGLDYQEITQILDQLSRRYRFKGFKELGETGVARETGLPSSQARLACQRHCSEPIKWQDSEERLQSFREELHQHGLYLARGGRFYHVMGPFDKGASLTWLLNQYRQHDQQCEWISVGLGDSRNDIPMLEVVDQPVLIPNPHAPEMVLDYLNNLIQPRKTGPAGWHEAMSMIVEQYIGVSHG